MKKTFKLPLGEVDSHGDVLAKDCKFTVAHDSKMHIGMDFGACDPIACVTSVTLDSETGNLVITEVSYETAIEKGIAMINEHSIKFKDI